MLLEKTNGVIVRRSDYTETSKILTIYTERFGKCKFLAKGASRKNSKFTNNMEPFSHVEIEFYYKDRPVLLLNSCDLIENNFSISDDLETFFIAYSTLQLIEDVIIEREENRNLYNILVLFLNDIIKMRKNRINLYYKFLLGFNKEIGFKIDLSSCVSCSKKFTGTEVYATESGLICSSCFKGSIESMKISPETLKNLSYIEKEKLRNLERLKINRKSQVEIEKFFNTYMGYNIEEYRYPTALKISRQNLI